MIPRPGLALVRPVVTQDTLPGGRIILTENVRKYTAMAQAELLDIGTPADAEDYQWQDLEEGESAWEELSGLQPGAWLLVRNRVWVEADVPDVFLLRHEDILAVLG